MPLWSSGWVPYSVTLVIYRGLHCAPPYDLLIIKLMGILFYYYIIVLYSLFTVGSEPHRITEHAHFYIPWSVCVSVQRRRPWYQKYLYSGTRAMDHQTSFSVSGGFVSQISRLDFVWSGMWCGHRLLIHDYKCDSTKSKWVIITNCSWSTIIAWDLALGCLSLFSTKAWL